MSYKKKIVEIKRKRKIKSVRWPGIEPGSTAWKAAMLTTIPPTPTCQFRLILIKKNILTSLSVGSHKNG